MSLLFLRNLIASFLIISSMCTAWMNGAGAQDDKTNQADLEKTGLLIRDQRIHAGKIARKAKAKDKSSHKARQKLRSEKAVNPKSATSSTEMTGCCECTTILSSDFGQWLDSTYVIATPGKYVLGQDVIFMPAVEFTPAINILCNDVVLDLCNHTLSQGNTTQECYGIQIGQGTFYTDPNAVLSNITVQNGTVREFTGVGLYCYNASFDYPDFYPKPTSQTPFQNLQFLCLNVLECGPPTALFTGTIDTTGTLKVTSIQNGSIIVGQPIFDVTNTIAPGTIITGFLTGTGGLGTYSVNIPQPVASETIILGNESQENGSGINLDYNEATSTYPQVFDPTTPVSYSDVLIEGCNVNSCFGHGAVNIFVFDNLVINNTTANDSIINYDGFGFNFGFDITGRNLQMVNCQANGTSDFDPTPVSPTHATQCGGLSLEDALNTYVKDCQFNDTFGETSYIVNNNLSLCSNCVYENVQFNNSRGGFGCVIVAGVHRSSANPQFENGNGYKYINCQFNGATVSLDNPGGLTNSELVGMTSISTNNDVFESCQFCNIGGNPNYVAYGIFLGSQPYRDVPLTIGGAFCQTFKNCIFSDIHGGNIGVGLLAGVVDLSAIGYQHVQTNYVVEDCIFERISSTLDTPILVAGFAETPVHAGLNPARLSQLNAMYPKMKNVQVNNCRFSDIHAATPIPDSAALVVRSVEYPVITDNSISDFRGILLTGTNEITPNAFQLAATKADALAFQPLFVPLTTVPATSPLQTFKNVTRKNNVTISPSLRIGTLSGQTGTVDTQHSMIWPTQDLNCLGWKSGDAIEYNNCGGSNIDNLVNGSTYYLIVYVPGYSEQGLIKNNDVSNCSLAGFEDTRTPSTSSVWLSNTAFCNGANGKNNYAIRWGGKAPVTKGNLNSYPRPKSYADNIAIECETADKTKKKHKKHQRKHKNLNSRQTTA